MERDTAIRSADIDLGYFDLNNASEEQLKNIIELNPEKIREIMRNRPYNRIEDVAKLQNFTEDDVDALRRGGAFVGQPEPPIGVAR
jgi:hypothetical protein